MNIQLLNCGGTIDKSYNPSKEILEHTTTHWDTLLKRARICPEIQVFSKELFLKDSNDMTEEDFEKVVEECKKSKYEHIMIAHGTSKMHITAQKLGEKEMKKTIILFGAMLPFELAESDALFNFGFALAAVQEKKHGVYIAMNGKIFPWNNVVKNIEQASFATASLT
jgi:L-asparaginase